MCVRSSTGTQMLHSWSIQTPIVLSSGPQLNNEEFCLFCILARTPEDKQGQRRHVSWRLWHGVSHSSHRKTVKFWNILQINKLPSITHAGPQRPYVLIPPFTSHSTLFIPISEDVHPPNGVPGNARMNGEAPELRALVRTEREGRGKVKRD